MSEFERRRLARLVEKDSSETSPVDALALAREWIDEYGDDCLIVVIQKPEGGVVTFHSGTTLASAVFLLEAAKLNLLR